MADKYNNFDCKNEKENEDINEDNYIIDNLEKTEITLCFDLKERNKSENSEGKKYLVNMNKETLGKLIQDLENSDTFLYLQAFYSLFTRLTILWQ